MAKDMKAIDETPQASPFSPSIKLMALVTPNTAKKVKGIPQMPRCISPRPNRFPRLLIHMPVLNIMIEVAVIVNKSFIFQLVLRTSSMIPSMSIKAEDARYDPTTLSMENMNGVIRSTPDAMAIPPNFGVG